LDSPLRYGIWEVDEAFVSPLADIALLHLMPYNDAAAEYVLSGSQKQVLLNLFAPPVGERVVGLGFHSSEAKRSKNPDGSNHIDLNDKPTATVGEVREIHIERRDTVRLNFPCFRVNARFDGGMSGGPVFNDTGQMCGVICSSMPANEENEEHVSYAASLWPAMGILIRGHRGQNYPKDITYPLLDLAREGIIGALGWQRVNLDPFEVPSAPGGIVYGVKYR
jgi:hypothetical protein